MWWKLVLLGLVTSGLIFAIIPFQTHAQSIDLDGARQPQSLTIASLLAAMEFPPASIATIIVVLALAFLVG